MQDNTPYRTNAGATTRPAGSDELGHLKRLSDMDHYKVADGDLDIRGWDVKSADGNKVGEVDNLIVDTDALKVRYLDIELDRDVLKADRSSHVVVPIGTARLDDATDCVLLDTTSNAQLSDLSRGDRTELDRDTELELRRRYDKDFSASDGDGTDREFYAHPHYDQDRFFGNRRQGRGEDYLVIIGETDSGERRNQAGLPGER